MTKRIAALIVAVLFAMTLMAPAAFATHRGEQHGGIEPVNTACTTPGGGNQPPGQGTTCTGQGLNQQTENQNRGGNAPRGQQ